MAAIAGMSFTFLACAKDGGSANAAPAQAEQAQAEQAAPVMPEAPAAKTGAAAALAADEGATEMGKTVGGDDSYSLVIDSPDALASGSEGVVHVKVVPKTGWKMNKEFPTKLKVEAPSGVEITKAEQRVADAERFDDGGASFAVKFKSSEAGQKSFSGQFKFAVCTDTTCDPKKEQLAWVVDVQ
ncbi:hypothetical protein [Haliangium ochraceum]|uniref:hypothetical protein n=1 Tax=Haliangium ochraceum TaxID=80816 RepID=UPI000306C4B9|nr:hypothetical protein [Haliangium ochraceum]